ncbi:hypothetical protein HOLleu_10306 [Holothuria leucospilota]|uniref:Uncharacterized protein n=1 Tax=Holothuria leucospilota TaxID=206669 RepID=A0A9Q1CDX8_HOLLE|nr:hypothetical protein HOLleu_10306 [Holothuria leucospilota]
MKTSSVDVCIFGLVQNKQKVPLSITHLHRSHLALRFDIFDVLTRFMRENVIHLQMKSSLATVNCQSIASNFSVLSFIKRETY